VRKSINACLKKKRNKRGRPSKKALKAGRKLKCWSIVQNIETLRKLWNDYELREEIIKSKWYEKSSIFLLSFVWNTVFKGVNIENEKEIKGKSIFTELLPALLFSPLFMGYVISGKFEENFNKLLDDKSYDKEAALSIFRGDSKSKNYQIGKRAIFLDEIINSCFILEGKFNHYPIDSRLGD